MAGFKESVKPAVFDGTNRLETNGDIFGGAELPALGLACWFKISPSSGFRIPLGLRGVLAMGIDSSNRLTSYVNTNDGGDSSVQYNAPLTNDVWYFAVCTYDKDAIGDSLNLYLNGELVDSGNQKRIPTAATNYPVSVGQNAGINQFTGEIYDSFVYSSVPAAEQIKTLYGQGVGIPAKLLKTYGLDSGLLAGYDLHGDNPLVDLSGNGNHLANVNNVTFDGDSVDVVYQPLQTVVGATFSGTNYLEVDPNRTDSINKITVFSFVRVSDVAKRQDFFGRRGWCYLRFSGGNIGASLAMLNGAFPSVGIPAENDRLYFVAGVYDSSLSSDRLKLYIDGELATASNNMSGDLKNDNYQISIGALSGGLNLTTGEVYGGGIFEDALTPEDIRALYNRGVGVDLKKLPSRLKDSAVGLYPLDDLLDYSGNGNDLTNVNNVALTATNQGQRLLDKPPTG